MPPVFAVLWLKMGKRNPSSPAKFSIGLFLQALGFAVQTHEASVPNHPNDRAPRILLFGPNAQFHALADRIITEWDRLGLPTERKYA